MADTSHLDAILQRLSREQERMLNSKGREREYREVLVAQINRELESECKLLGFKAYTDSDTELNTMTDDELMEALNA